jgi:hypothetical protein
MKGIKLEYKNSQSNTLTILSKNCKGKWFSTSKNARFSKFLVLCIILFERVFEGKKSRNE